LTGLLLLVAAVAVWFLLPPPKVTARTKIYVAPVQPRILYDVDETGQDGQAFLRTQMSFLRSPLVLRAALRDPEVYNLSMIQRLVAENIDPQQWLEEKLEVEASGPEFLRIGISGDKPEELSTLVKAVTRSYMQIVVGEAPRKRKEHLNKLKGVQEDFKKKLKRLEAQMRPVEDAIGVGDHDALAAQQKIALLELEAVQKEYVQVHSERRKLQVELRLPEKGGPGWDPNLRGFAAAMNALPGPIPPVNPALIRLLYDGPLSANEEQAKQMGRLATLRRLENVLANEVLRLHEFLQQFKRTAVDTSRFEAEHQKLEKFLVQVEDKIQKMEVEEEAPPRISWLGQKKTEDQELKDGEASIYTPSNRTTRLVTSASLAGLGVLLLGIAGLVRFRARKVGVAVDADVQDDERLDDEQQDDQQEEDQGDQKQDEQAGQQGEGKSTCLKELVTRPDLDRPVRP
jgi:hypothetical protein